MNTKSSRPDRLLGAGILSAIAASVCCITPPLALISGVSGMASAFSWMEPARPFLIGFTLAMLGFVWYQRLRSERTEAVDCACEHNERSGIMGSKKFLGLVTVFAALMLAFPYYSHIFYPVPEAESSGFFQVSESQRVTYEVQGMTCGGCEAHIQSAVNGLEGVISVKASHAEGTATVEFDPTRVSKSSMTEAINATGYHVRGIRNQEPSE